jgi:regulator of RNase E activity RraA
MHNDDEFFRAIRQELYTAVVGDVLDDMGCFDHFLPGRVQPLDPKSVVVGRARPVLVEDAPATPGDPFGKLLEALDSLEPHEVYITNGGATPYALWGELMSTRAARLGAVGAVMNGYCRDAAAILELGFPTFCWGSYALDVRYRGKVIDFGVPTVVGDIPVAPGDVVFGDRDGVLIVPQGLAAEVFGRAFEKVRGENAVRDAFRAGMSAVEAFRRFGVM